jgi:hypothetical protein
MKNKLFTLLSLLFVGLFVFTACAPATPPPTVMEKVTEEFKMAYNDVSVFYASYAALDAQEAEKAAQLENKFQQLADQNKDDFFLVQSCYKDTAGFFSAILTTTYGPEGIGGAQDDSSAINLLALGQTLPPGVTVEECQRGATSIIINSRALRADGFNLKNEILRIRNEKARLEKGTINSAVMTEFYQKYGQDMQTWLQNGDQAFAEFIGSKSQDQVLPAKFLGLPTELLVISTRNKTIGEAYLAIAEGRMAPPQGKYAYNYGVSFDPATGIYTLSKEAASGYITMLITPSSAVQENLESGCTTTFGGCDETPAP